MNIESVVYDGRIWSKTNANYYISQNTDKKFSYLHRYIYEKHNGPIPNGFVVHHKDGNRINNDISNLTTLTNSQHAILHDFGNKYGHVFSIKTKLKMSNARKGKPVPKDVAEKIKTALSKPILQLTKDNILVKEFSSIKEVKKELKLSAGYHISESANGKRKSAYGYIWRFKSNE